MVVSGLKKLAMSAAAVDGGLNILADGRKLRLRGHPVAAGPAGVPRQLDGADFTVAVKPAAEGFIIRHRATTLHVLVLTPRSAELHGKLPPKKAADTSKMVLSPMPGLEGLRWIRGHRPGGEDRRRVAVLVLRAERDGTRPP